MQIVPDTSAIIDGRVSEYLSSADETHTVVIAEAVVSELEAQANNDRQSGWDGLEELQHLVDLADTTDHNVEYDGDRPTPSESVNAHQGDIDALIRDLADEHDATLFTSDVVQAEVAEATDISVEYFDPDTSSTDEPLAIEDFFDEETMSVHLKTGARPKAKRGSIGDMEYEFIGGETVTSEQMHDWASEVEDSAYNNSDSFIELSETGMTIVQFQNYRIAVARPPFADDIEITAVRPIVKTDIDDYDFSEELTDRLKERQRGVLISGAPGAGKSTFAQAVAEFLNTNDYAVKTMENPRDLQVGEDITQYTALAGDMENTADSLLLVRPDYTIYDEVRKTDDFEVFADMRLAGVGMVGVVHATRAIDALQRLVGRVELGMIPQIVDTVVYIEAGEVDTVYDVTTEVKVPEGMQAEDLARPVIQVRNFETDTPEYEIYTFNRQVVTVPLDDVDSDDESPSGVSNLARNEIEREFRDLTSGPVTVDVTGEHTATVYLNDSEIPHVIGEGGNRISDIEDRLGMTIDVQSHSEAPTDVTEPDIQAPADRTPVSPSVNGDSISFTVSEHSGETVEVYADDSYLFTATVGQNGTVSVKQGNAIADELQDAIDNQHDISIAAP